MQLVVGNAAGWQTAQLARPKTPAHSSALRSAERRRQPVEGPVARPVVPRRRQARETVTVFRSP